MTTGDDLRVGGLDEDLANRLGDELNAFNMDAAGCHDQADLSVRLTDPDGALAGGLTGWIWGDCAGIEMLWVRADRRGHGDGSRLLRAAEDEARGRGCVTMMVSSMTFQAPDFYRRHGYVEQGRSTGIPGGHADVHFLKRLDDVGPPVRLAAVVVFPEQGYADAQRYEDAVLDLLAAHGGRLDQRLRSGDGRTEVHLVSFPDRAAYQAFLTDPARQALRTGAVTPVTRAVEVTPA